jgi:hypothetical protein
MTINGKRTPGPTADEWDDNDDQEVTNNEDD